MNPFYCAQILNAKPSFSENMKKSKSNFYIIEY